MLLVYCSAMNPANLPTFIGLNPFMPKISDPMLGVKEIVTLGGGNLSSIMKIVGGLTRLSLGQNTENENNKNENTKSAAQNFLTQHMGKEEIH